MLDTAGTKNEEKLIISLLEILTILCTLKNGSRNNDLLDVSIPKYKNRN